MVSPSALPALRPRKQFHAWIGKTDVGEILEVSTTASLDAAPALSAIVEEQLEAIACPQSVGNAVPVEIEQAHIGIVSSERRRGLVGDEWCRGLAGARDRQRLVAGDARVGDQQVDVAIAVCVG